MSESPRISELIDSYFAGQIPDADLAELQQLLGSEPKAAELFVSRSQEEEQLRAWFRLRRDVAQAEEMLQDALQPAAELPTRRRMSISASSWAAVAVLVLVALGAGIYWGFFRPPGPEGPSLELVSGSVTVDGTAAKSIPAGREFAVAGTAPAVVQLPDGSRAELTPESTATIERNERELRQQVKLVRGAGRFQVEKGEGEFQVQTPVGAVKARGTEFTVEVRQSDSRSGGSSSSLPALVVAVLAGHVDVSFQDEVYSLGLGDNRIYAAEKKSVQPPQLVGRVLSVSSDRTDRTVLVIEPRKTRDNAGGKMKIVLGEETKLSWVNIPDDRQTPSVGYLASIWKGPKGEAESVQFSFPEGTDLPPDVTGRVSEVSKDGLSITIQPPKPKKGEPAQPKTITIGPETVTRYFFISWNAERPTAGYQATVWLEPGSFAAREIHFAGDKRTKYQGDLSGRIISVSDDGQSLELVVKGKDKLGLGKVLKRTIQIGPTTEIRLEDDFPDLKKQPLAVDAHISVWLAPGTDDQAAAIRVHAAALKPQKPSGKVPKKIVAPRR